MPRVASITSKADLPAEHHAVAEAVLKVYGDIRGPWTMLLHSPKLTEKMLPIEKGDAKKGTQPFIPHSRRCGSGGYTATSM